MSTLLHRYCIPKTHGQKLHDAMNDLCPTLIHNDPLWLSEDVAMVRHRISDLLDLLYAMFVYAQGDVCMCLFDPYEHHVDICNESCLSIWQAGLLAVSLTWQQL